MEFFALNEGTFVIDHSKKFKYFDSQSQSKKDFKGAMFLDVQPFLVKLQNHIILLDTGLGFKNENGELILFENLKKHGIQPTDITHVLLSHLHRDHVGGLVRFEDKKFILNFPNAKYYISKPEWDCVNDPERPYHYKGFDFLLESGAITFFEGNGNITPEISYEFTGGHTEYHAAFHVIDPNTNEHLFFGGDILTLKGQIGSTLLNKSDKFPKEANKIRQQFVDRAVTQGWTCLFYHGLNTKFGKIIIENSKYKVI